MGRIFEIDRILFNIENVSQGSQMTNLQNMRYLLIVSSFLCLIFTSCGKMEDPIFNNIENVKVNKVGLSTSLMTFDMQCFNPNNTRAKLKEAEGEAWLDSNYLGRFHVDTTVQIPAISNFKVPVKLDVDMKFFLNYTLFGVQDKEVLVTVKGNAKVGKSGIYKKIPLHYEGRKNLAELIK